MLFRLKNSSVLQFLALCILAFAFKDLQLGFQDFLEIRVIENLSSLLAFFNKLGFPFPEASPNSNN